MQLTEGQFKRFKTILSSGDLNLRTRRALIKLYKELDDTEARGVLEEIAIDAFDLDVILEIVRSRNVFPAGWIDKILSNFNNINVPRILRKPLDYSHGPWILFNFLESINDGPDQDKIVDFLIKSLDLHPMLTSEHTLTRIKRNVSTENFLKIKKFVAKTYGLPKELADKLDRIKKRGETKTLKYVNEARIQKVIDTYRVRKIQES